VGAATTTGQVLDAAECECCLLDDRVFLTGAGAVATTDEEARGVGDSGAYVGETGAYVGETGDMDRGLFAGGSLWAAYVGEVGA